MRNKLSSLWYAVRLNFWFIPTLLSFGAIVAAFVVIQIDLSFRDHGLGYFGNLSMPIEGARLALSTIAGSMITVSSLVFSLTLVALTMVSQQLGPRILMLFMDDRPTQIVLGLFVATFIFSLVVLLRIGDVAIEGRVPGIAVVSAAVMAIFSLGMMIHFIHHIATRIQADVLITRMGNDLCQAAEHFVAQGSQQESFADDLEQNQIVQLFDHGKTESIALERSGYLSRLDVEGATDYASKENLMLRMEHRPGAFLLSDMPVLSVVCLVADKRLTEEDRDCLRGLLSVTSRRTPEASLEFEICALVEVALRALSPGLNDPFTAMACIDRLGDGMKVIMERDGEQRVSRDVDGKIRVVHIREPFSRYLRTAFAAIHEAAQDNRMVQDKLRTTLDNLSAFAQTELQRKALINQVNEFSNSFT